MIKLLILFAVLALGAVVMTGIDMALGIQLPKSWKTTLHQIAYGLWGAAILGIMNFLHL